MWILVKAFLSLIITVLGVILLISLTIAILTLKRIGKLFVRFIRKILWV